MSFIRRICAEARSSSFRAQLGSKRLLCCSELLMDDIKTPEISFLLAVRRLYSGLAGLLGCEIFYSLTRLLSFD